MNSDRESVYRQDGASMGDALEIEAKLAERAKRIEAKAGATRFAAGRGRHGVIA